MDKLNELIEKRAIQQFEKFGFKKVSIDFDNLKKLGQGNFGAVYLYKDHNGKEHVLKVVDMDKIVSEKDKKQKGIEEQIQKGMINEVVINRVMNDENIIKAEDCFVTPEGQYCIVFEKMERTLEARI